MSRTRQGSKTGRRERHLARQAALRERKTLRKKRAAIHSAMGEAAKMQRSKRKGTRDFEANMASLGFRPRVGGPYVEARELPGDVMDKYEEMT